MTLSFASLGLAPELVRAVDKQGYTHPTPVQSQAIPAILAGRDVLAGAQTGTGKTAGFTLPMLQRLSRHAHHGGRHAVRALVLAPTRELAAQVEESVRTYGAYLPLRSTLVYGGVGINPQIDALRRGVDVLVATPGRLLDHVGQRTVHLSHVEILVLDEADRMLDMGFIRDIRKILALLPAKRQNLLFSATFSDEIRELANGLLDDPVYVEVARRNAESDLVTQRVHPVDASRKRALLAHLVSTGDWRQVLVFTRTKHGANRLAEQLCKDGVEATAIHGNKSQNARTRALAGFKAGDVRVLVATDIAARGLDIEALPHVVNYELPNVPEDYVHRIGRTGRAGVTGEAISLVSPEERGFLADIEKLLKRPIERQVVAGFEPGTAAPAHEASATAPQARPAQRRDGNRGPRSASRASSDAPRRDKPKYPDQRKRGGLAEPRHNSQRPAQQARPKPADGRLEPGRTPAAPDSTQRDDERQPASNATALFPSSGPVFGNDRRDSRRPGRGSRPIPALLGGGRRTS
ncbi:MAG: DEAD/DEAH box helicase [Burkholderiales bacterium]